MNLQTASEASLRAPPRAAAVLGKLRHAIGAGPAPLPVGDAQVADRFDALAREARRTVLPERCAMMERHLAFLLRCLTTTRTIDEAFRCLAEIGEIYWAESARLRISRRDGRVALLTNRSGAERDRLFVHNLRSVSIGLGALDWLSGGKLERLEASFAHAPVDQGELAELFPYRATIGGEDTVLALAEADLRKPVVRSPGEIDQFLSRLPLIALRGVRENRRMGEEVHAILDRELCLHNRLIAVDELCDIVAMSTATLHRRLKADGTTFRELREIVLNAEAVRLLDETTASVATVAERLGYSEERPFRRSFARWNGCSPAAWRARGTRAERAGR